VYQWNSVLGAATGPALFTSATVILPNTNSLYAFQPVQFNTGGVNLSPGDQYVLFASVSDPSIYDNPSYNNAFSAWGANQNYDPYPGGNFVYLNNRSDETLWTSSTWYTFGPTDLAFKADYGPSLVPEPSTLTLLGIGVVCSLGYGWRCRKQAIV
jgi:hypothetical protein